MADYKGNTCPVCKQKFKEADDIVVCPDCGTPYHRECWKKVGVCVHQADHAAGFEWTPDNVISDRPDDIVCPNCGTHNPLGANTATTAAFRCRTTRITCSTSRITPPPAATARCTPTAATRPAAPRSIARHRAKNRHPTRNFSVQAAWGRMALPARKSAPMTRLTASKRGTGPAMLGRPAFII